MNTKQRVVEVLEKQAEEDGSLIFSADNLADALIEAGLVGGLHIPCDKCGEILTEPGALIFEPTDDPKLFRKTHICRGCSKAGLVGEIEDKELREYLWLSHNHKGIYGDDGEMQCSECLKYGVGDYKRQPIHKVISAAIKARAEGRLGKGA